LLVPQRSLYGNTPGVSVFAGVCGYGNSMDRSGIFIADEIQENEQLATVTVLIYRYH
jgi:hypothetical protein